MQIVDEDILLSKINQISKKTSSYSRSDKKDCTESGASMIIHKQTLASGRWFRFTLMEQLANVGTDVDRAARYKKQGDLEHSQQALFRALELIDFTVMDPKNKKRLKEILRARECLVDFFMYDNEYGTSYEFWYNYFYQFNYAAAIQKGR